MANPKHCQKEKLLRHIRSLDFDHIFLDLSAGCAFNALDFFLAEPNAFFQESTSTHGCRQKDRLLWT